MAERRDKQSERRGGPDIWVQLFKWLGGAGWLLLVFAMWLFGKAKPDDANFTADPHLYEQAKIPFDLRTTWDEDLTAYIFYIMIVILCLSVSGLLINAGRLSRDNDAIRINLIVLGVISILGIAFYIF